VGRGLVGAWRDGQVRQMVWSRAGEVSVRSMRESEHAYNTSFHARAPAGCSSALVMPAVVMHLFGQDFVLTDTSKWLGHTLARDVLLQMFSDEARLRALRATSSRALPVPPLVIQLLGQEILPADGTDTRKLVPPDLLQCFGQELLLADKTEGRKWLGNALARDVLINMIYDEARLRTERKWIHLRIYVQDRDTQVGKNNKIGDEPSEHKGLLAI
jgi:hypothetical protein